MMANFRAALRATISDSNSLIRFSNFETCVSYRNAFWTRLAAISATAFGSADGPVAPVSPRSPWTPWTPRRETWTFLNSTCSCSSAASLCSTVCTSVIEFSFAAVRGEIKIGPDYKGDTLRSCDGPFENEYENENGRTLFEVAANDGSISGETFCREIPRNFTLAGANYSCASIHLEDCSFPDEGVRLRKVLRGPSRSRALGVRP